MKLSYDLPFLILFSFLRDGMRVSLMDKRIFFLLLLIDLGVIVSYLNVRSLGLWTFSHDALDLSLSSFAFSPSSSSCRLSKLLCKKEGLYWNIAMSEDIDNLDRWRESLSSLKKREEMGIVLILETKGSLSYETTDLWIYLSLDDQEALCLKSSSRCRLGCHHKNVGSLYAILCGAQQIRYIQNVSSLRSFSPLSSLDRMILLPHEEDSNETLNLNPYTIYGQSKRRCRGLTSDDFQKNRDRNEYYSVLNRTGYPKIVHPLSLSNEMDLSWNVSEEMERVPSEILISPNLYVPLDGEETYSLSSFFVLFTCPSLDPLLYGDLQQRILRLTKEPFLMLKVDPISLEQTKTEIQEEEGVRRKRFQRVLDGIPLSGDVRDAFYRLYFELYLRDYVTLSDLDSFSDWMHDLDLLEYRFPEILAPSYSLNEVAICITGQADRGPKAIPPTLERLSTWYPLGFDLFFYVSTFKSSLQDIEWIKSMEVTEGILYRDIPLNPEVHATRIDKGNHPTPNGLYQQMYGLLRCYQISQEHSERRNKTYKAMIRLRTDTLLTVDLTQFTMEDVLHRQAIYVPIEHQHNGYNDRIAIGPYRSMEYYMTRYLEVNAPEVTYLHAETFLKFILKKHNVTVLMESISYHEI